MSYTDTRQDAIEDTLRESMSLKEAKQLHNGDEVYWNDPNEGACSRHLQIQSIDVGADNGDLTVVYIMDADGSVVECFVKELS